ncbi:hypothetical protein DNU06_10795 [Putridiphycobacter roseus]|uniref:DUF1569 domain-containing protein n=1 Tax=Putridiphycobacter roseus TaxID=2219161 RepID=A0A2W1MZP8_9FLAO|nr:DUF1569 domain-containing protein [Putridiphycobacter roseus]PZE16740.1 hypothetical protein DNU06_10795 [Putridiphycobacter roseus]
MKSAYNSVDCAEFVNRINNLTNETKPEWGKMNASQMLAHLNVSYELAFDDTLPQPGAFKKFMLNLFVKKIVVGDKPYKKNSPTAPEFKITDSKDFEKEKQRLIDFIDKTQSLGAAYFDGKESNSFGKLSKNEWNTMFVKHLNHHLTQFGV